MKEEKVNKEISLFSPPIHNTNPLRSVSLDDVSELVRNDVKLDRLTETARELYKKDKQAYSKFKDSKLPYVTFSGTFNKRCNDGLINHSGLICIDIDNIKMVCIEGGLEDFRGLSLFFDSPSNNGIKFIFKVDMHGVTELEDIKKVHYCYVQYLVQFFNSYLRLEGYKDFKVDNLSDVSRPCYLVHDISGFLRPNNGVLSVPVEELKSYLPQVKVPQKITNETFEKVKESCIWLYNNSIDITGDYQKWVQLGLSLASLGEKGGKYFHKVSYESEVYDYDTTDEKFTQLLKSANGTVTIATFFQAVQEAKDALK